MWRLSRVTSYTLTSHTLNPLPSHTLTLPSSDALHLSLSHAPTQASELEALTITPEQRARDAYAAGSLGRSPWKNGRRECGV